MKATCGFVVALCWLMVGGASEASAETRRGAATSVSTPAPGSVRLKPLASNRNAPGSFRLKPLASNGNAPGSFRLKPVAPLSPRAIWVAQDEAPGEMIDNDKNAPVRRPPPVTRKPTPVKPTYRKYGLELRGGMLFFPEFMLNALFFDESEGVIQGGFGAGFVLRTSETFEYVFGISYNFFGFQERRDQNGRPIPHVFLNKGDPSYQREFVTNTISYLAIDVRFQKTFPIHPRFHFLLGGGIGLGIVIGGVKRTDTFIPGYEAGKEEDYKQAYKLWRNDPAGQALPNLGCNVTGNTPVQQVQYAADKARQECNMIEANETRVPPVIPVFDFIVGMVFPLLIDRWDIRVQGGVGLPRLFWVSLSTHIYF